MKGKLREYAIPIVLAGLLVAGMSVQSGLMVQSGNLPDADSSIDKVRKIGGVELSMKIEKLSEGILPFLFESTHKPKKFSSEDELKRFLLNVQETQRFNGRGYFLEFASEETVVAEAASKNSRQFGSELVDFSTTNVQVQSVDEPDFLKNDGKYVYILSKNKLTIIDAYPPQNATIVTKIGLEVQKQNLQNMFLKKDRLIIFYQSSSTNTNAMVLDISDIENPKVVKNYSVRGNYHDARMIGDHVYFIARSNVDYDSPILPSVMESSNTILTPDVYYFDDELYHTFNTVTAIDIFGDKINADTFMMDSTGTIYVSEEGIYITYPKYHQYHPYSYYMDEYEILAEERERTVIHKIAIDRLSLNYASSAEVPGHVLNQFSMDEFDNKFRIATTSELYTPKGTIMHSNIYVLDEDLEIVGKLEGIAPDERIYSARFMGDKLYLVTFRQVDPFFVIDLSENNPKVLGYLKMPGFSNYLHPYDENHIIGLGRDTKENNRGGVATLGIKIALFDVSDVSNPLEVDVFTIGDRTTNSEALYDHKAFFFDKKKDVLSIPLEFNTLKVQEEGTYNEPKGWNGFYILGVDAEDGFSLNGKVDHSSAEYDPFLQRGYGSRSFYIGDVLYTVTNKLMKMNDLKDMSEMNQIDLDIIIGRVIKYID